MTEGMPQLIAAEIDSYDQVLQRAIKAEQELAAANRQIEELRTALHIDDDEVVEPPTERGTLYVMGWDEAWDQVWASARRVLDGES